MKTIKKILSIIAVAGVLLGSTLTVCAEGEIKTNQLWVSAGGSAYTSNDPAKASIKKNPERTCYMRLVSFKFDYYPENNMPSSKIIYSRLYLRQLSAEDGVYIWKSASNLAGFNKKSKAGQFNYGFQKVELGGLNQIFRLKTNSSCKNAYWAKFDWRADKY